MTPLPWSPGRHRPAGWLVAAAVWMAAAGCATAGLAAGNQVVLVVALGLAGLPIQVRAVVLLLVGSWPGRSR